MDASVGLLSTVPPRNRHVWLAAGCLLLLYLGGSTGQWLPSPDSAMYLGLGRSLAEGKGYTFNGESCNSVTPGLPMVLGALRHVFGDGYWAPNLFMGACAAATVAMGYWLIARMSDRRTALAAAICCACSDTFFWGSRRILTDTPFGMLFWATLCAAYLAVTRNMWWLAATVVLAFVSLTVRVPGLILLGPVAVGMMLDRPSGRRSRRVWVVAAALLVTTVATVAFYYVLAINTSARVPLYAESARRSAGYPLMRFWTRLVDGLGYTPAMLAETFTGQDLTWLGLPLLAIIVAGAVIIWRRGQRMPIIGLLTYMIILPLTGSSMVRPRYMIPVQPMLAYMAIEGVMWAVRAVCRKREIIATPKMMLKAVGIFTVVVVAVNSPRVCRRAVWYNYLSYDTDRFYSTIRRGVHAERYEVTEMLKKWVPPDGSFTCTGHDAHFMHYITRRHAVRIPSYLGQAGDAEAFRKFLDTTPNLYVAAVDADREWEAADATVFPVLENSPRWKRVYSGRRWHLYQRIRQGAGAPATSAPANLKGAQ